MTRMIAPVYRKSRLLALLGLGALAIGAATMYSIAADAPAKTEEWHVHDRARPQPPGPCSLLL